MWLFSPSTFQSFDNMSTRKDIVMPSKNTFDVCGDIIYISGPEWNFVARASVRDDYLEEIQSVTWGLSNTQKCKMAASFAAKNMVINVEERSLSEIRYRENTSNLLSVLDKYGIYIKRKEALKR